MNRCDGCKHKDSCVCVPYGCECFEFDLEEHDKQIRAETIDELENWLHKRILRTIPIEYDELVKVLEQMKEQKLCSNGKPCKHPKCNKCGTIHFMSECDYGKEKENG